MLTFSNKAQTLLQISTQVKKSKVLPQLSFSSYQLLTSPAAIQAEVSERFSVPLIVRSSALSEDTLLDSQAGKYLSVPNVSPDDVLPAMERVSNSFVEGALDDLILIQPMLTDIGMSGVLFTIEPSTGGNYFVINYDRSGLSDGVTSGCGKSTQLCYLFHGRQADDPEIDALCVAASELMRLFANRALDIEFAFTTQGELYILQVRPLIVSKALADHDVQARGLAEAYEFLAHDRRAAPSVKGHRAVYGVMPDWNPAEMIGTRPKRLALSLYRRLITDRVWAEQRYAYGYMDVRGVPLMINLCGMPYIDVRASFNSFIPRDLDDGLAAKLADHYLETLATYPAKHDKIEFDIVYSCYTLDLPDRIIALADHGFDDIERAAILRSVKSLTNRLLDEENELWRADRRAIGELEVRHRVLMSGEMDIVSKTYWLLENCARFGTLPFAGLARCDFIGTQMMNSLISIGIMSYHDRDRYLQGLRTVSADMERDRYEMTESHFIAKYGHLRPGTYDILSPRYDDTLKRYFLNTDAAPRPSVEPTEAFTLTSVQRSAINKEMAHHGLLGDASSLIGFIKAGIEGREYAKFVFTKSLSDILELVARLGAQYGFTREQMAYADISVINELYGGAANARIVLERSIATGMKAHEQTLSYTLPPLITRADDIYAFHFPPTEPNFITLNETVGEVCTNYSDSERLADKIVMIPAADPGFDWIFLHGIRGFITAYGGANSHMAIRAMQLGIPAVVGTGEQRFTQWAKAKSLHIDCANKKVDVVQ